MSVTTDDILAHYGVKGMKWGRRKQADGTYKTTGRQAKAANKRTSVKSLSDEELKQVITRLQMEQQYAKLMPVKNAKAKKLVAEVLEQTGKEVAKKYATEYAIKGLEAALKTAAKK